MCDAVKPQPPIRRVANFTFDEPPSPASLTPGHQLPKFLEAGDLNDEAGGGDNIKAV